jgi:hypothetical protein
MQDVFYDWFDDEWAPKPVITTTPAHRAERRKLLDSLRVEIASADDPLASLYGRMLTRTLCKGEMEFMRKYGRQLAFEFHDLAR